MQHQAYVDMVEAERAEQERQYEREMQERRKIAAQKKRVQMFLDESFDDNVEALQALVKDLLRSCDEDGIDVDEIGMIKREERVFKLIECADANENTALSEAAAGGANLTLKYLLDQGADPNAIGNFGRTALYRAVFAGHYDTAKLLLDGGADPRIKALDLNTPEQITSDEGILQIFLEWKVEETDRILKERESAVEKRKEQSKKRQENEKENKENHVADLQKKFDVVQKATNKAYQELEKRMTEHDTAIASGFDRTEVTIGSIHQAELDLETSRMRLDDIRTQLQLAKLTLREQVQSGSETSLFCGVKCNVRELDDVLFKDVGNKIAGTGMGIIILTELGRANQAATFLRYRDTNYLHILSEKDMCPDNLRVALLGSIRYGKLLLVDFDNMDMFETLKTFLNNIRDDLFDAVLSRQVTEESYYTKLVKPKDHKDYQVGGFNRSRIEHFKFVVLMKTAPEEDWLNQTYPIQIVPTQS